MTDTLFTDNSHAGYDNACHDATLQLATTWGLDARSPAHQLVIAQRLTIWAENLRRHATTALGDHDPLPRPALLTTPQTPPPEGT